MGARGVSGQAGEETAIPAGPDDGAAGDEHGDIVVSHLQLLDVSALLQHEADDHAGPASHAVDGDATGEVDGAEGAEPAAAPDPVRDGVVHDWRPARARAVRERTCASSGMPIGAVRVVSD